MSACHQERRLLRSQERAKLASVEELADALAENAAIDCAPEWAKR